MGPASFGRGTRAGAKPEEALMTAKHIVRAGLVAAFMFAAPLSAQAQPLIPDNYSFDAYRAAAITAGLIAGSVIAIIVTDGLIIPVYAAATGGAGGGLLSGALRLLGAVSGGLYADALYMNPR
jgi:hypothetical protein